MEVYIILTDTGTLFTKMIKVFTRQPLNHASISFTKKLDMTYSFGRKRPRNPFVGGFVKENLEGQLFQQATCAIYRCQVSEIEYKRMQNFIQQIELEQHNYKYNFIGLFGYLLNKQVKRKNAYFCSEFVATILKRGGVTVTEKLVGFVTPNDLIDDKSFQLIYEGQLQPYLIKENSYIDRQMEKGQMKRKRLFNLEMFNFNLLRIF